MVRQRRRGHLKWRVCVSCKHAEHAESEHVWIEFESDIFASAQEIAAFSLQFAVGPELLCKAPFLLREMETPLPELQAVAQALLCRK